MNEGILDDDSGSSGIKYILDSPKILTYLKIQFEEIFINLS